MEREDKFFIVSLLSLAMSLFLFPLALYLVPQVWLGWVYHTPDFILNFNNYLQSSLGMNQENAQWIVINILFLIGVVFAIVAYVTSRHVRIDHKKEILHETVDEARVRLNQVRQHRREVGILVVKLVFIFLLVFVIAQVMQWAAM